jgi:peptide/nickel transport system substrate-binding protein
MINKSKRISNKRKSVLVYSVVIVLAIFIMSTIMPGIDVHNYNGTFSSDSTVLSSNNTTVPSGSMNYGLVTSLVQSSFNPFSAVASYYFYSMLYLPFASYNFPPSSYLQPVLAQNWSHNANYTSWNLTLKPNLKWDNGASLTSKDLMISLALENQTGALTGLNVVNISIVNTTTVNVRTSKSEPNFMVLYVTYTNSYIYPFSVYSKYDPYYTNLSPSQFLASKQYKNLENFTNFKNIIADGPFVLSNYSAGANPILFHANKYFYRGAPKMSNLAVRIFSSVSSMGAAIRSGEIDAMWDMGSYNTVVAPNFKGLPNAQVFHIEPGPYMSVDFNMWAWPFNTTQFRMALAYMTDRDSINSIVNSNNTSDLVGYNLLTGSLDRYIGINPSSVNNYSYNLSEANKLLGDIGIVKDNNSGSTNYGLYIYNNSKLPDYGDPVLINITTTQLGFGDLSTAIELEDQWSTLGFKVSITTLSTTPFYTLIYDKTGWDVAVQIDPIGYYPDALTNEAGITSYDNSTAYNFNSSFGMANYNYSMISHISNESYLYTINTNQSNVYAIELSNYLQKVVPTIPLWVDYNWEAVSSNYYWGNQTNHTGIFNTQALVQPQFWYGALWVMHTLSTKKNVLTSDLVYIGGGIIAAAIIIGVVTSVSMKRKKSKKEKKEIDD